MRTRPYVLVSNNKKLCNKVERMKLSVIFYHLTQAETGCYWATGNTGAFLECLPEHYIQGACESGQRAECRLNFR